jgi:dephospho-CoA kinase
LHPVLVLEGMPGAGKTTAATALAAEDYSVIGDYDDAAFATPECHKGCTGVVFAV